MSVECFQTSRCVFLFFLCILVFSGLVVVVVVIFAREVNEDYVKSGTARVESGYEGTAAITPPAVSFFSM